MTTMNFDREVWDLAGIDVEGSPVAGRPWDRPPHVGIKGDHLHWRYTWFAGDEDPDDEYPVAFGPIDLKDTPKPTKVRLGALLQFVSLPRRPTSAVASFAGRWGVLHLCSHGIPRTHPQGALPLFGDERRDGPYCQTVYGQDIEGSEPVSRYLAWATRARAVLNIASTFDGQMNGVDLAVEWSVLLGEQQAREATADADSSKRYLARELELWLRIGAVRPRIDLIVPPKFTVGGPELFGMLALQLAAAVTSGGPTICSSCGEAYVAEKQPSAGRRAYCSDCRKAKVPQRDASRAYRQRKGSLKAWISQ